MKIRDFLENDVDKIQAIYQQAFTGWPWYEYLSAQEVGRRWEIQRVKFGFGCLVAEISKQIVGATWWDIISPEQLLIERGVELADFVNKLPGHDLVWLRETCVNPEFQSRGIASLLKKEAMARLESFNKSTLLLTRMREDNVVIISINTNLGFNRTGIKVPSSQVTGVFHEYWYKEVN